MLVRPPPPLDPSWRLPSLLGDHADAEAHERLRVARHLAVARDDEDLADLLGEARLDLDDVRVVRVRGRRGALEQAPLLEAGHVERHLARARSGAAARRERAAIGRSDPPPLAICAAVSAARFIASQSSRST